MKKVLTIIIVIIAIILIIPLFMSKDMHIEREVVINKPKDQVFGYIKMLNNHANFSKWILMDPNIRKTSRGTDGTVGFVSAWDSDNKNVGKGEQEINKIEEGSRIDYALRFEKPMKNQATAYMTTEAVSATTTKVKWVFEGPMMYPMNLLKGMMENKLGGDLQEGLNNLKNIMEQQ